MSEKPIHPETELHAGQTVYLKPGVNGARHSSGKIDEGILKTIGRKYYTVTIGLYDYKFNVEDLRQKTEYCPDYYLYFSKQEILDESERNALIQALRRAFDGYRKIDLTLDQLRRIKAILDEGEVLQG